MCFVLTLMGTLFYEHNWFLLLFFPSKHSQDPWRLDWGQTKNSQTWPKISPDLNQQYPAHKNCDDVLEMIIPIWAVIWPSHERHQMTLS